MLLRILAALPVTTAEAERMFSKVDKAATAVRSSMDEDRLESLILIQAHRDQTPSKDLITDRFYFIFFICNVSKSTFCSVGKQYLFLYA